MLNLWTIIALDKLLLTGSFLVKMHTFVLIDYDKQEKDSQVANNALEDDQ